MRKNLFISIVYIVVKMVLVWECSEKYYSWWYYERSNILLLAEGFCRINDKRNIYVKKYYSNDFKIRLDIEPVKILVYWFNGSIVIEPVSININIFKNLI